MFWVVSGVGGKGNGAFICPESGWCAALEGGHTFKQGATGTLKGIIKGRGKLRTFDRILLKCLKRTCT